MKYILKNIGKREIGLGTPPISPDNLFRVTIEDSKILEIVKSYVDGKGGIVFHSNDDIVFDSSYDQGLVIASGTFSKTYTIPKNSTKKIPVGTRIEVLLMSGGIINFVPEADVEILTKEGISPSLNEPFQLATIIKENIDSWLFLPEGSSGGSGGAETDPTVPSYVKNITEQDIANWNNNSGSNTLELINPLDPSQFADGLLLGDGTNSTYNVYKKYVGYVPVNEGDKVIIYSKETMIPINFRGVAAYDTSKVLVPSAGTTEFTADPYIVPAGISYIRFCLRANEHTPNMQLTRDATVKPYDPYGLLVPADKISKQIFSSSLPLAGTTVLAYGDSITAGDEWLNIAKLSTGIDFRNMAVGGAHFSMLGTRDEATNPFDWRTVTDYELYGDRHLVPQIDHTPNVLRWKYDLVSPEYLEDDGRYIYRPDIVVIAIGFNDWKWITEITETYNDVKDLSFAQLEARRLATPSARMVYTTLRYALEKLLIGEITETRDGITYGVDCRMSKFYFSTPLQSAFTNTNNTMSLRELGDMINICLEDYSIVRIDGNRDSGIDDRREIDGSPGRYLIDGIHPNASGYQKMGQLISGQLLSHYRK